MRRLLELGQIVVHPFVVAELALGALKERKKNLALLDLLPHASVAQPHEVRMMIEARRLFGSGIGLIDACLLASAFIGPPTVLWTRHKQLRRVAESLGLHADLP